MASALALCLRRHARQGGVPARRPRRLPLRPPRRAPWQPPPRAWPRRLRPRPLRAARSPPPAARPAPRSRCARARHPPLAARRPLAAPPPCRAPGRAVPHSLWSHRVRSVRVRARAPAAAGGPPAVRRTSPATSSGFEYQGRVANSGQRSQAACRSMHAASTLTAHDTQAGASCCCAKAPGRPRAPAPLLLLRLRARARQVLPRRLGRLLGSGRRAFGRRPPLRLRGRLRCGILRSPPQTGHLSPAVCPLQQAVQRMDISKAEHPCGSLASSPNKQ